MFALSPRVCRVQRASARASTLITWLGALSLLSGCPAGGTGNARGAADGDADDVAAQETPLINTLFSSGFEQGMYPWLPSGDVLIAQGVSSDGMYSGRMRVGGTLTADIYLGPHSSLHVEYSRVTAGLDTGESLTVDWSTNGGSTWTQLEQTTNTSWQRVEFNLPSSATASGNLRLRFRAILNDPGTERVHIDDVVVTGDDGVGNPACATCGELAAECGTVNDPTCGQMINCGSCDEGSACSPDHRCVESVTVNVPVGDPRCPGGVGGVGVSTDGGDTFSYVCNGATGPTGPRGPMGPQGPQGQQGQQGEQGDAPVAIELLPGDPNCEYGGSAFEDGEGGYMYICNLALPGTDLAEDVGEIDSAVDDILATPIFNTRTAPVQSTGSTKVTIASNGDILMCDNTPRWVAPSPPAQPQGSLDFNTFDTIVMRYTSQGIKVWEQRMTSGSATNTTAAPSAASYIRCTDIDVHPSGNIVVGAETAANASRVWELDGNGVLVWTRTYTGLVFGTRSDSQNNIIVGLTNGTALNVYKYTSANAVVWSKSLGTYDARKLAMDSSDGFVVVSGRNNVNVRVMRYNSLGNPAWSGAARAITLNTSSLHAHAVALDAQNNITIGIEPVGVPGFMLARMTAAGVLQWTNLVHREVDDETLLALDVTPTGTIYAAGRTMHPSQTPASELFLQRYSSSGAFVHERNDTAVSLAEGRSVAIDSNGRVILGGTIDQWTFVRMYLP